MSALVVNKIFLKYITLSIWFMGGLMNLRDLFAHRNVHQEFIDLNESILLEKCFEGRI